MAFRDQILCIKAETTPGTLESLTGSDAIQVGQFTPTIQDFGAAERPVLGPRPGVAKPSQMVERKMTLEVPFEVAGSGTAGVAGGVDKLFLAAGMNRAIVTGTSVTYGLAWPIAATRYSINFFLDGVRYAAAGGLASSIKISAKAGGFLAAIASLQGLYRAPLTAANPAPTFPAQAEPVTFNEAGINAGSIQLGGFSLCVEEFELSIENTLAFYDRAGCTPSFDIVDRSVTGSVTFERPAIASYDVMTAAANSTIASLVVPIGKTAGNITTFNLPSIQLGPIELVDLNGKPGFKAPFTMISSATNQELTIAQT